MSKLTLKICIAQVIACWILIFLVSNQTWAAGESGLQTRPYDLRIAVASNFYITLARIVEAFEAESGYRVSISSGSSGILSTQILRGAPFDLFFSADSMRIEKMLQQGRIKKEDSAIYARGILLLVASSANTQEKNSKELEKNWCGLSELMFSSAKKENIKMALAKPDLAPYGEASLALMDKHFSKLLESKQVTLVYGNNVSQVAQYFTQAGVDFAWLPLSMKQQIIDQQAVGNTKQLCFFQPSLDTYPGIFQHMALLQNENTAAKAFWLFMQSEQVSSMIRQAGYLDGVVIK